MVDRVLYTKRLKLRPVTGDDAYDIAVGIGDWNVLRWLTSPPWPYRLEDAHDFINRQSTFQARGIDLDGKIIGVVGITPELDVGYWLATPYHGQGYMTEAAVAAIADHFRHCNDTLTSGYLLGNAASRNVLTKLGFQNTFVRKTYSRPKDKDVDVQRMELTAAAFNTKHLAA